MHIINYSKTLGAITGAAFALLLASSAQAGPAPSEIYKPVKTVKQAQSLKPGTRIAISCGNCGGVTTLTVDPQHSYMKGVTCPSCKRVFYLMPGGGGRAATQVAWVADNGKIAQLSAAGKL